MAMKVPKSLRELLGSSTAMASSPGASGSGTASEVLRNFFGCLLVDKDAPTEAAAPVGSVPLVHPFVDTAAVESVSLLHNPASGTSPPPLQDTAAVESVSLLHNPASGTSPPLLPPPPLLLSRQGDLLFEHVQSAAQVSPLEWEDEMQHAGHVSQQAFAANFLAPHTEAVSDPAILNNMLREVEPSVYNRAPHGQSGASSRAPPTSLEFGQPAS